MLKRNKKIIIPTQEEVEDLTGKPAAPASGAESGAAAAEPDTSQSLGAATGGEPADAGEMRTEAEEYKDKYLRTKAEMANFRRRADNNQIEAVRYGNAELLRALLPTLDDLERVVTSAQEHAVSTDAIIDGMKITLENFRKALLSFHVVTIEGEGEPFNPAIHEALMQQPSDDYPDGTVLQVVLKGYRLHDRVLRPAKVIVSKRSEDAAPGDGANLQ